MKLKGFLISTNITNASAEKHIVTWIYLQNMNKTWENRQSTMLHIHLNVATLTQKIVQMFAAWHLQIMWLYATSPMLHLLCSYWQFQLFLCHNDMRLQFCSKYYGQNIQENFSNSQWLCAYKCWPYKKQYAKFILKRILIAYLHRNIGCTFSLFHEIWDIKTLLIQPT